MREGFLWTVRLAASAEEDFESILRWTTERFGKAQSLAYAQTLSMAIEALAEGPSTIGAKSRNEILKGLFSLHVARAGRRGSHFVMFRVGDGPDGKVIDVLRLLHDSMELSRHFPGSDESA